MKKLKIELIVLYIMQSVIYDAISLKFHFHALYLSVLKINVEQISLSKSKS